MQLLESMKEVLQEQFPNSRWSVSTKDSKQYLLSLEEFPGYKLPEDPQERVLVHLFEGDPIQIKVPSNWFKGLVLKGSEGATLHIAICAESIYEMYPRKWELYSRPDWPEVEFHSFDQSIWVDRPAIFVQ